jgi:hypothetical protein
MEFWNFIKVGYNAAVQVLNGEVGLQGAITKNTDGSISITRINGAPTNGNFLLQS